MLTPDEGEGHWDVTRIRDEMYVLVENHAYRDPRIETVPGDGLVQFNFKVSGDMTLTLSRSEQVHFNRPSLLIWSQPSGVDINERTEASAHERSVAISVRPEFLAEQFLQPMVDVPTQLRRFGDSKSRNVAYCQLPLTAQMLDAAMRLINNPFSGITSLIYIEAVALELLCMAVNSFGSLLEAPSEKYTDRDLSCLHAARKILMKNLARPPTPVALARAVGLAENTLSKGFRSVFGETVAAFSLRCRMQHALTLLRDQRFSVSKASEAIGYTHATSFTTAFRRHFGIRPIDVRVVKSR